MQPSDPDPAYADQARPYAPPQQYTPPPPPQYAAPQWPVHPSYVPPVGYSYAPRQPSPSVATTIIAGVFAILSGLYQGFQAFVYGMIIAVTSPLASESFGDTDFIFTLLTSLTVGSALAAILLIVGAILLLVRRLFGRWLVAIGCALTIVISVVPVVLTRIWLDDVYSGVGADLHSIYAGMDSFLVVSMILWIAVPVVIVVLAFLPSTRRYCTTPKS
jgi:hypothetical protein